MKQNNELYKNQRAYYWRHRKDILKKLAAKRADPEYHKRANEIALKSYYKRKEEKNAGTENQVR